MQPGGRGSRSARNRKDRSRFEILRKTEICKYYIEGHCPRTREECAYAHGEDDLRVVTVDERAEHHLLPSARKWRTELCFNYTTTGNCRYGDKCAFIHDNVSSLRCRNIPVKEALDFVLQNGQAVAAAAAAAQAAQAAQASPLSTEDYESLSNAYAGLSVDIPTMGYYAYGYPSTPSPAMVYAYTPMPYPSYPKDFAPTPATSFTPPPVDTRVYRYSRNAPRSDSFPGTPYPIELPSQKYSFDSPNGSTRSYRLFPRGAKASTRPHGMRQRVSAVERAPPSREAPSPTRAGPATPSPTEADPTEPNASVPSQKAEASVASFPVKTAWGGETESADNISSDADSPQ